MMRSAYFRGIIAIFLVLLTSSHLAAQDAPTANLAVISLENAHLITELGSIEAATEPYTYGETTFLSVIRDVIFSSEEDFLLVEQRFEGTNQIWDLPELTRRVEFDPEIRNFQSIISPDGTLLASTDNSTLRVWETQTGTVWLTLERGEREIGSIAFSPDGRFLIFTNNSFPDLSSEDGIYLWDIQAKAEAARLSHPGVTDIAFSPNGTDLISGSLDGSVRLWNLENEDYMPTAIRETDGLFILDVKFVTESLLAIITRDIDAMTDVLTIWDIDKPTEPQEVSSYASLFPLGNVIYGNLQADRISRQLWNVVTGEHLALLEDPTLGAITLMKR